MALTPPDPITEGPPASRRMRTGTTAIERLAVLAVARDVAAMPASLVAQLALWPDDLAHWARRARLSESLVYNTLAGRKPYTRVRQLLAERFGVGVAVVGQLIDARRVAPTVEREPGDPPTAPDPAVEWSTPPLPATRDGGNPIERRAVRTVARDVAAMAASTVVGLAMWPETLSAWTRAQRLKSSVVWATLAGSPSEPVRDLLARRLGVSRRELADLVDGERRSPSAQHAWALTPEASNALLTRALADVAPDPPAPPAVADDASAAEARPRAARRNRSSERPAPDGGQSTLDL